jgi:type I restriction enzyme S subunit
MNNVLLEKFDLLYSEISSSELLTGTFRLDSQYYILFKDKFIDLAIDNYQSLEDCCIEIYEVPLFKHIYIKKGVPFYTSSDLFNNEFIPSHFLADEMPNIHKYKINKGQILMARSGNVESGILGELMIVGNILNGSTTSDHVLRFTVNSDVINIGYLATCLMSKFCQGQIMKNAAGAVIPAIRPDSLRDLKIPRLSILLEKSIGKSINIAIEKREEAIFLLNKARTLVLQYNNLPLLDDAELKTLDPDKETDIHKVSTNEFTQDYRLDAHFYNPMAKKVIDNIEKFSNTFEILENLTNSIFMCDRFSRIYVDKEYGRPFLSGKNIIQIRPALKYISLSETSDIENLQVKKGWILLTRSGTLGRVGFIWNNYEDFTATDDIVRIVSNDNVDSGYLYAFLSSEYGYHQILRYKYGAVIDHLTPKDIGFVIVPICRNQKEIGDLVRQAYDLRAEAIYLENEAQEILTKALTGKEKVL